MNHEGEQGGGASLLALDAWRAVSAQTTGWLDTTALDIAIVVNVARGWRQRLWQNPVVEPPPHEPPSSGRYRVRLF